MQEYPCELIRDLMPGVLDDIASSASRDAVALHIDHCVSCAKAYADMRQDWPEKHLDVKQVRFLGKVKRSARWKVALAALLAAVLTFTVYLVLDGVFINIPFEDIKVQEFYRLSDGRIACAFTIGGLSANQCYIDGPALYEYDRDGAKMDALDQDFVISYNWFDRLRKPYDKDATVFYVAMWRTETDPEDSLYGLQVERLYYGYRRDVLLAERGLAGALPATKEIEETVRRGALNPAIPDPPILP